jgi:hypothetical protein
MLRTLREFRDDFGSVSLKQGELTISVTFAEQKPEASKPGKPQKERLTAIEALSRKPPEFDFEVPS